MKGRRIRRRGKDEEEIFGLWRQILRREMQSVENIWRRKYTILITGKY